MCPTLYLRLLRQKRRLKTDNHQNQIFTIQVKISAFVDKADFAELYSFAGELPSPFHPIGLRFQS